MNNGALCKEYFNVILQTKSFDIGQICPPDDAVSDLMHN